jgi:soluble lytic murein transglycosylase-like protein
MPGTARDLGVANRFDPIANISGAARYLRQMLDKFGVVHLALAAYNAGPGAVERAGGIPLNGETPIYVRDVLRHWQF